MTHIYEVTGMTCEACEYKIQHVLGNVAGVKSVTPDKSNHTATVEMDEHIPVSRFQEALKPYPKYTISEKAITPVHTVAFEEEQSQSWFATYKPLLLIFAFISGISLLTAFHAGIFEAAHFNGMHFMNHFMAGFFLVFSFFKFLNLKGFAESYAMYDVLAMKVPAYGYVYPFIELALGIAYLINFEPFATNVATIVVMGFSSVGVIMSVLDKKKIRCACLGAVFNLPMSTVTIIEDLLMVGMAVAMLVVY